MYKAEDIHRIEDRKQENRQDRDQAGNKWYADRQVDTAYICK